MTPKKEMNVLDAHGGFTALTGTMQYVKITNFKRWDKKMVYTTTLWRPGSILKDTMGTLESFNENSFFQNNNDVTEALYRVKGYRYKVVCWFDNKTGRRIA